MRNKKIFTLALAMLLGASGVLVCGNGTKANAEDIVTEKMRFAAEMDKKYVEEAALRPMTRSNVDLDELISQAFFAEGEEKALLLEELSTFGIYRFNTEVNSDDKLDEQVEVNIDITAEDEPEITPYGVALYRDCGTDDVAIYAPEVYYQAASQTWVVSCGGQWKNGNALPWLNFGVDTIGDPDAFGVGYTSIKTEYNSAVVKSYAYIEDESGSQRETTDVRSDGNGALGFGFRLQDRLFSTATFTTYVGHVWYGACTYDKDFSTYDAVATGYYTHTYSSCDISEITFGVTGKEAGVNVVLTKTSKGFTGYGTDTKF